MYKIMESSFMLCWKDFKLTKEWICKIMESVAFSSFMLCWKDFNLTKE